MTTILHLLKVGALIILWGDISMGWWIGLLVFLSILYCAGKTHRNAVGHGPEVERLWFRIAGIVFIVDILSVICLYFYIFIN